MTDNMQIVLNAFETLFNKRDYAAAERFWSPNYIQHSAHIPPGREGLFALIKGAPEALHYENGLTVANGDYVLLHGRHPSAACRCSETSFLPDSCGEAGTKSQHVLGGATGAHNIHNYQQVSGIMVPHRRRVYPRRRRRPVSARTVLVSIDHSHIGFRS